MDSLTHYTRAIEGIAGILAKGFVWMPNPRNLISKLVAGADFANREPQQFGMISFTDWTPPAPLDHRTEFGDFGIVISREWARSPKYLRGFHPENVGPALRAQRVVYIEEGPLLDTLRLLYTTAFNDLSSGGEGHGFEWLSATSPVMNRAIAGVEGKALWTNLLTVYEYLEEGEHAYQSEWRIVHPIPVFGYPPTIAERIASSREAWGKVTDLGALSFPDEAITGFVCPRREESALRQALPPRFSERPIVLI